MKKTQALLLALLLSGAAAAQEVAYVTDILRLGIHRAEDTSDRAFDNLVSGTELEVLERVPNFARVRTSEGQEGWVKSAYIVAEKPAQARVAEIEAENEQLRSKLEAAEAARQIAESQAERATTEMTTRVNSAEAVEDTLARLQQENETYESRLDSYRGALPLSWVAAALGVALIAGFVGGIWWLDASIRRRHGGFRVY